MPNSEPESEDLLRLTCSSHLRRLRAALWVALGVVSFSSDELPANVIFALLLFNGFAMRRWARRPGWSLPVSSSAASHSRLRRRHRALVRRSHLLGTLCDVAAVCIALVIGSVGAALGRHGLSHHFDENSS